MKNLKYGLGLIVVSLIFSGCIGKPSLPQIDDAEAFSYIKEYEAKYEKVKEQNKNLESSFKWIQPKNKKEQCKIYVGINSNDDKTLKLDYILYWDGECKSGYASGLGREIEKTMIEEEHQIGFYEGGKAINYCTYSIPLEGIQKEGECSYLSSKPEHYVATIINDKQGNLEIKQHIGVSASINTPVMYVEQSPFNPIVTFIKGYPNFGYVITDFTKDEFDIRNFQFDIKNNQNGKIIKNGFGFASMKQGGVNAGEMINETLVRRVQLPQSYFDEVDNIFNEIKTHVNIALDAQKKAQIIKEKYKTKICKDSINIDFMDNNEYKDICNEEKKFEELKNKIDEKLAQIEKQKQAKREQINQQKIIQIQQTQTAAAIMSANAQQQANTNQSLQNLNNNLQMQQLNNNLMMNNLMPKRYDVYVH